MKRQMLAISILGLLLPAIGASQIGSIVVTSGASFQPGLPPKESIGTIFCTGLKVSSIVGAAATPLPTTLAGIAVTVGGVAAPLFAVAEAGGYQQINFQVPVSFSSLDLTPIELTIAQNGVQGAAMVQGARGAPGDFFRIDSTQLGVFQHGSDYTLVSSENPAQSGEAIIG